MVALSIHTYANVGPNIWLCSSYIRRTSIVTLDNRQRTPKPTPTLTLAVHGLEELFFQLWFCVSFWFWRKIGFGLTYLCT